MPRALITGITGQDGSYLAELLLEKGYEVHGLVRRSSSFNTSRLDNIYQDPHEAKVRLRLHHGDLSDSGALVNLIRDLQPDEVYNLGAQSHVMVSFDVPEYTGETTGMGTVRILEAIRASQVQTRFYQASSSEMFGAASPPQNEDTSFHPRSPYGVAKMFAYWTTVNYREAHGIYASNGILFNHECVTAETPVVIRKRGFVDVVPIGDVVPHRKDPSKGKRYTSEGGDLEVWDGQAWSRCTARTATWHQEEIVTIHGRGAIISATKDHVCFVNNGEKPAGEINEGDGLLLSEQPAGSFPTTLTEDEAWLLGALSAEGYVSPEGQARIVCSDESFLAEAADAWSRVAAGAAIKTDGLPSGFGDSRTPTLELRGNGSYLRMLRHELYTNDGQKRIPKRILNAAPVQQVAFLSAYNRGDGLRAGNGIDFFKSFRTTSPVLATGLIWLARTTLGRRVSVYEQKSNMGFEKPSFLINLSSSLTVGNKGAHLRRPQDEVRKVTNRQYEGWMCDLATESGRFAAGVGLAVVHNSPRRGETFVTRKITRAVARIKAGLQEKLYLGNLDAKRDWGYAPEYVEAMWMMLQLDEPGDFVIGTGEAHTPREFAQVAFDHVGLDWERYVEVDPKYFRPSEVDYLLADPSKAKKELGWEPKTTFAQLVQIMVDADVQLLEEELSGKLVRQDQDN